MGPTGVGKTDLAIQIATQFPVEIISVDSGMIYRGMDIGTAKPSEEERQSVPHHLIDILDPSDIYSAAQFQEDALGLIEAILQRGKIPLLVGGTMLYFKALLEGLAPMPAADSRIRTKITEEGEREGWEYLYLLLEEVDPCTAKRIKPTDIQRLQRALEVYELTGVPMSAWWEKGQDYVFPYNVCKIAITPRDRTFLVERIQQRFDLMIERGFLKEVEQLYSRPDLHSGLPAIRCVGYRQVWDYLSGKLEYSEMLGRGVIATRQLAKRQMTWLRGMNDLHHFECEDFKLLDRSLALIAEKLS